MSSDPSDEIGGRNCSGLVCATAGLTVGARDASLCWTRRRLQHKVRASPRASIQEMLWLAFCCVLRWSGVRILAVKDKIVSSLPTPPQNIVQPNCDNLKASVHVHNTHKNSVSFEYENTLRLHYKDRTMKDVSLTTAVDARLAQSRYQKFPPSVRTLLVVGSVSQWNGTLKHIHTQHNNRCV